MNLKRKFYGWVSTPRGFPGINNVYSMWLSYFQCDPHRSWCMVMLMLYPCWKIKNYLQTTVFTNIVSAHPWKKLFHQREVWLVKEATVLQLFLEVRYKGNIKFKCIYNIIIIWWWLLLGDKIKRGDSISLTLIDSLSYL